MQSQGVVTPKRHWVWTPTQKIHFSCPMPPQPPLCKGVGHPSALSGNQHQIHVSLGARKTPKEVGSPRLALLLCTLNPVRPVGQSSRPWWLSALAPCCSGTQRGFPPGNRHHRGVWRGVLRAYLGCRLLLPLPGLEGSTQVCPQALLCHR